MRKIKIGCIIVSILFFSSVFHAFSQTYKERNKAAKQNLEKMHRWYYQLVQDSNIPAYLFETTTVNCTGKKNRAVEYLLIDPEADYSLESMIDLFTFDSENTRIIKKTRKFLWDTYGAEYYDKFVSPELEKASIYLAKKKLPYSKIYLQVPVELGHEVDVKAEIDAANKISGSSRELFKLSDSAFLKTFKKTYFEWDSTITMDVYYSTRRSELKDYLIEKDFGFDFSNVDSLVQAGRYKRDFDQSKLPADLLRILYDRFEKLKTFLPEEYRSQVQNTNLKIAYPDSLFEAPTLWVRAVEKDIYISPALLRAAYTNYLSQSNRVIGNLGSKYKSLVEPVIVILQGGKEMPKLFDRKERNNDLNRFQPTTIEVEMEYDNFISHITIAFDFILLHEMGHLFLPPDKNRSEDLCDCLAIKTLKSIGSENLGIFRQLIIGSKLEYWRPGNPNKYDYQNKRYKKLISLLESKISIACE